MIASLVLCIIVLVFVFAAFGLSLLIARFSGSLFSMMVNGQQISLYFADTRVWNASSMLQSFEAFMPLLMSAAVVGVAVVVLLFLRQRQEIIAKREIALVGRILSDSAAIAGITDYVPIDNSVLWQVAQEFRSFIKSRRKEDPQPHLSRIVKESFPREFQPNDERVLIGMCQLLFNPPEIGASSKIDTNLLHQNNLLFLSRLSEAILNKIEHMNLVLTTDASQFKMTCWRLSRFLESKNLDLKMQDIVPLEQAIQELESRPELRQEYLPFLARVLGNFASGMTVWGRGGPQGNLGELTRIFMPLTFESKLEYCKQLAGMSRLMIAVDAIIRSISLDSILEAEPSEWGGYFDRFIELGYRGRPIPLAISDALGRIDYKKRFQMADYLASNDVLEKKTDIIIRLVELGDEEKNSFFEYDVPLGITKYCIKNGWKSYPFLRYNRRAILDLILVAQEKKQSSDFLDFIETIPDNVSDKMRATPDTQSILRCYIGNLLVERLRSENLDIAQILNLYGPPYDQLVDVMRPNIRVTILQKGNDRAFQDTLLALQSALLESKASKKTINEVGEWLLLWSSVNEKTHDAKDKYEYASKLLDVIESTDGGFEPMYIVQNAFSLIGSDLEKSVRIFQNVDLSTFNQAKYQASVEGARARLDAVKHAYYKLQLLAENQNLNLSDEIRRAMVGFSEEILGFVINCRRQDFLERMRHFPLDLASVLDVKALVKSSVLNAQFVFLPPAFHTFPLPALRVINEFLKAPQTIPYSGNKATGIIINPVYWVFSIAVGLTLQPIIAYTEQTYSNFFVPEYLRTASLAFKQARVPIEKLMKRAIPDFENLDSSNLLAKLFKQLADQHFFQGVITREIIIDALQFGGWDVSLADKIIEEKEYCVFCSFELPKDAKVCPNCERAVQKFDLSTIAPEDIEIDINGLGMEDAGTQLASAIGGRSPTTSKEEGQ